MRMPSAYPARPSIEFQALQIEILASLRGRLTRAAFNSKLNLGQSIYSRWEAGKHDIPWSSFLQILKVRKIDIRKPLRLFFFFEGDPYDFASLLKQVSGIHETVKIASGIGVSKASVSRWLKSQTEPSMIEVFQVMHFCTDRFLEFLAFLFEIGKLPSIEELAHLRSLERNLQALHPWVALIPRCFELKEYEDLPFHVVGFIANKIGISDEEEKFAIESLLKMGALEWKKKKLASTSKHLSTEDPNNRLPLLKIYSYWIKRHLEMSETMVELYKHNGQRLEQRAGAYRVFTANPTTLEKLNQAILDFDKRVTELLMAEDNFDDNISVQCLVVSRFDIPEVVKTRRQLKLSTR